MNLLNNWLFLALLAPGVYAVVNFIDKLIIQKYVSDYKGLPLFSAIASTIIGIILWLVSGHRLLTLNDALIALLIGMLTLWAFVFYFKAIAEEETSVAIVLFQTILPILVLIMSSVFLKEIISQRQFLGFILILLATIGISIKKSQTFFKFSPALVNSFFASLFWAISYILFKFISDSNSFWTLISFVNFGLGLGGLVLYLFFPTIKKSFFKTFKKMKKPALGYIFFNEILYIVAKFMFFLAISLGPVALVSILESSQVFYGIIYGFILTLLFPKIYTEDISKKGISKKFLMGVLAFTGIWLIS